MVTRKQTNTGKLKTWLIITFSMMFVFTFNLVGNSANNREIKPRLVIFEPTKITHFQDTIRPVSKNRNITGVFSKEYLLTAGRLDVYLEDFDFDLQFNIISYRVTAVIKGYEIEVRNIGPAFSKNTKDLIKMVKRGRKIYFYDIRVRGADGSTRRIESLVIKIR